MKVVPRMEMLAMSNGGSMKLRRRKHKFIVDLPMFSRHMKHAKTESLIGKYFTSPTSNIAVKQDLFDGGKYGNDVSRTSWVNLNILRFAMMSLVILDDVNTVDVVEQLFGDINIESQP